MTDVSNTEPDPIVGYAGSDPSGLPPHDDSTGYPGSDAHQEQFASREAELNPEGAQSAPETAETPAEEVPAPAEPEDVPGEPAPF